MTMQDDSTEKHGGGDLTEEELTQIADQGFLEMDRAEAKRLISDDDSLLQEYERFLQMSPEEKAASQFGTCELTDEAYDVIAAAMFKEAEKPRTTTET